MARKSKGDFHARDLQRDPPHEHADKYLAALEDAELVFAICPRLPDTHRVFLIYGRDALEFNSSLGKPKRLRTVRVEIGGSIGDAQQLLDVIRALKGLEPELLE